METPESYGQLAANRRDFGRPVALRSWLMAGTTLREGTRLTRIVSGTFIRHNRSHSQNQVKDTYTR